MSDERRAADEGADDEHDPGTTPEEGGTGPSADDAGGLGLTEEFARLEAEIEDEVGPRRARFDDADSSEWDAPAPIAGAGRDTAEWSAGDEPVGTDDLESTDPPASGSPEAGAGGGASTPETAAGGSDPPPAPADGVPGEQDPGGGEQTAAEDLEAGAEPGGDEAAAPSSEDAAATPPPDSDEAVHDGVPDAPTAPAPAAADAPAPANADAPATEHTVIRRPSAVPMPIAAAYGPAFEEDEIKDRTPALWWRFLTGSVVIVTSIATAVALFFLLELSSLAADLNPIEFKAGILETIEPGEPETILIVGSDKRSNTPGDPGRSDTTMLLRVDANNDVLSLFSLPRDLKVDIAGDNFGEAKLNEAYSDGGIQKTTKTVKELTGLEINHVVNVDFQGFADAVDAIGCVYVDVDRDYFNDNSQAATDADAYAAIDVNSGYQRLCGLNALDYVRYRHADNDFVRAARQQDFLRNARAQVPVREVAPIIGDGKIGSDLIDIFTKYTSSDIKKPDQMISVLKSFVGVRDVPINEVHFNGTDTVENGVAYVTASQKQIDKAVQQFLGDVDSAGGPARSPKNAKKKQQQKKKSEKKKDATSGANVTSTDAAAAACGGINKFDAFGRTSDRRLKFPVYVPQAVIPGSCYDAGSRQYDIKDSDDKKQPAYKMVIRLTNPALGDEYYGVEGTTWSDPPILDKPSETRTIDGRDYDLYYDGDRLRLVAFHNDKGDSFWVSNTLLQTLDEDDMIAIAVSMNRVR